MRADLIAPLKALHLNGMAPAGLALSAEPDRQPRLPEHWRTRWLEAEQTERPGRPVRAQLAAARFPRHRELASFACADSPLSEWSLRQVATAAFTATAPPLIFIGAIGTGHSPLAIARGGAAIHTGQPVRFYPGVDVVQHLQREQQLGKAGSLARRLLQVDAVLRDEVG